MLWRWVMNMKRCKAMQNKKMIALFSLLCGSNFSVAAMETVHFEPREESATDSGRASVEPTVFHPEEPDNNRWDLLQRLRNDNLPKLGYLRPKSTKRSEDNGAAAPLVGVAVDSASLKQWAQKQKGLTAKEVQALIRIAKDDKNFAHPDAMFLPDGKMTFRKKTQGNGQVDSKEILEQRKKQREFSEEIQVLMKKQRATYRKFFSRLTSKQKEQERKSFEIVNSEFASLAKLEKENPEPTEAIDKVKAGIKNLIAQMNKETFNEAAKPVVVKPKESWETVEPKKRRMNLLTLLAKLKLKRRTDTPPEQPRPTGPHFNIPENPLSELPQTVPVQQRTREDFDTGDLSNRFHLSESSYQQGDLQTAFDDGEPNVVFNSRTPRIGSIETRKPAFDEDDESDDVLYDDKGKFVETSDILAILNERS